MRNKNLIIFSLTLLVILLTSYFVYTSESLPSRYKPGIRLDFDTAINQAQYLYKLKKESGEDLSNGTCLSNALMPGWVADLVHNPRQEIDNLPENQCSSYLEGRVSHFVELDLEGNFVRAK